MDQKAVRTLQHDRHVRIIPSLCAGLQRVVIYSAARRGVFGARLRGPDRKQLYPAHRRIYLRALLHDKIRLGLGQFREGSGSGEWTEGPEMDETLHDLYSASYRDPCIHSGSHLT